MWNAAFRINGGGLSEAGEASTMPETTGQRPPRPPRRDAARNRRLLLTAAAEVFAERGTAASLKDVADRAGLGVGTVYRHMPDKQAVIVTLLRPQLERLASAASAAVESPGDPTERFFGLLSRTSAAMAGSKALTELLVEAGPLPEELRDLIQDILATVGKLMARAQAEGRLRADLAPTDIPLLFGVLHAAEHSFGQYGAGIHQRVLWLLADGMLAERSGVRDLVIPPMDAGSFLGTTQA
jgi:AcrR family transcriptional regulator